MRSHPTIIALAWLAGVSFSFAAPDPAPDLERRFTETVRPFVDDYCINCHGKEKPKAELDLSVYSTMDSVVQDDPRWKLILERLEAHEMPPEKAKRHPTEEERKAAMAWIESVRRHEAMKHAGDPGIVLARRLSNAEYDYTIRDLTGVDLRPTKEFPVDPANQAGFDNSGESLAMSPALLKKYLQAAQQVASHLVLKSDGLGFAPHPMLVETDRDKYCIKRIIDFYQRQPTDYADYFQAAWRYQHRAALGQPKASLADVAAESKVSAKYLAAVWAILTDSKDDAGPIATLRTMWRQLPAPGSRRPVLRSSTAEGGGNEAETAAAERDSASSRPPSAVLLRRTGQRLPSDAVRTGCEQLREHVAQLRDKLEWRFANLQLKGVSPGGQAFIGWKNRQYASHRMKLNPGVLQVQGDPKPGQTVDVVVAAEFGEQTTTNKVVVKADPELAVPANPTQRARHIAAFERFCKVFPDAFYVSERGRMHMDRPRDKGRLLSAGFHNMMGYFRDDVPLYDLVLDAPGQRDLDKLWLEFDCVAQVPERQHAEFIFYERAESRNMKGPEFDSFRSEDKDIISEAKIQRLAEVYLNRARDSYRTNGGDAITLDVIADHFKITSANIRRAEQARLAAEPNHLKALETFTERAYRRPLARAERNDLLAFYRSLRAEGGLEHEEAVRDAIVSVLVSPHFCYRVDLGAPASRRPAADKRAGEMPAIPGAEPLSDYALASRLSYFLWSSMPDDELLSHAAAGDLRRPEILTAQTRRMLKDDRARALAVEFGGNWLDFRRFEEHNAVDRDRFPAFNHHLREAMFQEPVRFFMDVVRHNRSALDFLYANHTFVNPVLAEHYGVPDVAGGSNEWVRVDDARRYGRGGLLPMSVFLTKNAPGLRTSPVKRGYWVVRRVLGEQIPPPPAVVPELPHDEAKLDLPLREVLAKHREDAGCAGCHARFDSFGLVFEGYGPVGERRARDLAGRPVDTHAAFPGGSEHSDVDGLRSYVRDHRQDDFVDNLCRKLFVYALGRTLMLSDDPAIEQMRAKLAANDYRFGVLVESIVTSPQFLTKRSPDHIARR